MSSYDLCNIDIPIPPLSEQKQIADYLDWKINEIDKLIDIEREKVNQLEIYKQKIIDSLMYSINSTYIPLKVVFNFGKGLNITKDNLGENGIRCVSYGEIHNDFAFSFSSSNSKLKGLEKVKGITISKFAILQKGDFIFVDTSEDLKGCGNFTYLEDSEREVYAGYHTIVGKLKLEINSRYLAYYFESYKWRKQIREMVNGIKVYSITQSILKSSKIQIPKKEVQNQIVEKIDRFMENQEKLISIINEKIDSLISLKQSLISEVVTGKIDVRDIKIPYYEKIDISNEKQEHLEERQV
jgi:TYPE I RESTRICTION-MODIFICATION SYSTEM SPECIFICITY SUBUNIT